MQEHWEWDWFCKINPILRVEDSRGIIARRDNEIAAACVFDNWLEGSVQLHLIVLRPLVTRHGFIDAVFKAAYGEDRGLILAWVPSGRTAAIKLNRHLGFTEVCRIHGGYRPGVDYILMQLKREDCKYLGE